MSMLLLKSMLFASVLQKSINIQKKRKKSSLVKALNKRMCRVCNREKGEIPIWEYYEGLNISKEIKCFTGVTMTKTDKLPKHLCKKCLDLLKGCITFRDMCQRTNKQMTKLSVEKETAVSCDRTPNEPERRCNNDDKEMYSEYEELDEYAGSDGALDDYEESNVALDDSQESCDVSSMFSEDSLDIWGCSICSKQFPDKDSYNSHSAICTNKIMKSNIRKQHKVKRKNKFLCEVCGHTSACNAQHLEHMRIHSNIFPFKCQQCPYKGRTANLLMVHKRSHLTDKPYKCTHCHKTTTSASNLSKHMKKLHSSTRPYKCSYCDKGFSFQYDMNRHVRDIHLRESRVECDVCLKKFNTKKILQRHKERIHKIIKRGDRHGRLPSYLQFQLKQQNKNGN